MTPLEQKNFKKELKALLLKYDVSIGFSCSDCSDTHGLYADRIVIYYDFHNKEIKLADGWSVDSDNL